MEGRTAAERSTAPATAGAPLISVVTPVYNGSRYLEDLIVSVREQDHPRVEHIVIDDGSDDDGATVRVLQKHPHLNWWSHANKGQYATLNDGLRAAGGDWICVISADDLLASPTALSALLAGAGNGKGFDAVFGRTRLVDGGGRDLRSDRYRLDESAPKWINHHFLTIHHCSMLVSRRFVEANDLFFDTSLRYTGDWDWIIRILKLGRTKFVDTPVSRYRVHEQQTRQTTARAALGAEDRLVLARHGSSRLVRSVIVGYARLRKLRGLLAAEGRSGAARAFHRFLRRH